MMEHRLPEYLRVCPDASPSRESTVLCGDVRITVLTPRLLRVEQGAWCDDATLTVVNRRLDACVYTVTDGSVFTVETAELRLSFSPAEGLASLCVERKNAPRCVWHPGDKPFANLGGTASTLDEKNGACPIGEGVCALDGWAVIDDSQTPVRQKDGWFAPRKACTDWYFFGYGHDYTAAVRDYCRLTGAPAMLPAFALGNWWSRYHKYTQAEYLALMDRFHDEDIPLSVGIVDMDWHLTDGNGRTYADGWTGFTFNPKYFPQPQAFFDAMHARGLKTALNLHPASGIRSHESMYPEVARAMGVDPESKKPIPFNCLDPKFLKAYFEVVLFPYEKQGVDFWWMDWQQGTDYARIIGEDYVPTGLEAITPLWMVNHTHYLASRRDGKRGMIFSRFGGYGSQRYPIGFSGDTFITWRSLDFQPYFTASASNLGYGWWSHDIGGHMSGVRDDELTARWVQLGVFSPIFRLHSTASPFTSREPWGFGPRAEKVIAGFMRLRHRLFPYLYTMNERAARELVPLVRPMYHLCPEEKQAYTHKNEYFFGSELLCAPITAPAHAVSGLGCASAWLPQGLWTDVFTGRVYCGGKEALLHRPMEQMPVLVKAGGIVPLQKHVPQSNKLGCVDGVELVIGPGACGAFTLYEDDGECLSATAETSVRTAYTLDWSDTSAVLSIAPAAGNAALIPAARDYTLLLPGFAPECHFERDGKPLNARYDVKRSRWTVEVGGVVTAEGAAVRMVCESGLLSHNERADDEAVELITHAQCALAQKKELLETYREEAGRIRKGLALREPELYFSDAGTGLADALIELLREL